MGAETDTPLTPELERLVKAARSGPVAIRENGHELAVVISAEDYSRFRERFATEFLRSCDEIHELAVRRGLTPEIAEELIDSLD